MTSKNQITVKWDMRSSGKSIPATQYTHKYVIKRKTNSQKKMRKRGHIQLRHTTYTNVPWRENVWTHENRREEGEKWLCFSVY